MYQYTYIYIYMYWYTYKTLARDPRAGTRAGTWDPGRDPGQWGGTRASGTRASAYGTAYVNTYGAAGHIFHSGQDSRFIKTCTLVKMITQ